MKPDQPAAAALGQALAAARQSWPSLALDEASLSRFLVERAERLGQDQADGSLADGLARLAVSELALCWACLGGDRAALQLFEERFVAKVPFYVHRLGLDATQLDELQQQLRDHLLVGGADRPGHLAEYAGSGSLEGWIRVVTVRMGLRLVSSREPQPGREPIEEGESLDLLEPTSDPELEYLRARYKREFREAFAAAVALLDGRERNLLRLSVLGGKSIDVLARMYKVHRATAARWVDKARERLIELTRADLQKRLAISASECQSLLGLLRSHLDLTVERFLKKC